MRTSDMDSAKRAYLEYMVSGRARESSETNTDHNFIRSKNIILNSQKRQHLLNQLEKVAQKYNHSRESLSWLVTISMIRLFESFQPQSQDDFSPPEASISEAFDELIEFVQLKLAVLIPVAGLELESSPIKFGTISLYSYNAKSGPLSTWLKTEDDNGVRSRIREIFKRAGSYAVASNLIGDHEYIINQGRENVEDLLHILRLFLVTAKTSHDPIYKKIASADKTSDWKQGLVLTQTEQLVGRGGSQGTALNTIGYKLDPSTINSWEKDGFRQIFGYLTDSSNSGLRNRIVTAIRWYGNAQNANTIEESFVSLAIALEGLFIGPDGKNKTESWGSITQKLAERMAFLLGRNYSSRKQNEADMRHLYGRRSDVVHKGDKITQDELDLLDRKTKDAIREFAKCEFETWDYFLDWVQKQKYDH